MRTPFLALALLVPVLAACDSTDDDLPTITSAVVADSELTTLEAAVIEAALDGTLNNEGTFTVFAPTDAAFTDLLNALQATPAELLAREDLGDILELHVLSQEVFSGDLEAGQTVTTLNGQTLTVVAVGSGFGLDTEDDGSAANAVIRTADIEASNGVVHKIDGVLIPN